MAPKNEAAGCVLVEPVRENRRARQAKPQCVERSLEIGAALGSAMHGKPGGLVDDQHQPVAMEHPRQDFVGGQFGNIRQSARLSVKTFVYGTKRLTQIPT